MEKARNCIYDIGVYGLKIISIGIMIFLTYYGIRYSVDVLPTGGETITERHDNIILNLLVVIAFVCVCIAVCGVGKKLKAFENHIFCVFCCAAATMLVLGEGLWWILAVDHVPHSDPYYVYAFSEYLHKGVFLFLNKESYFGMYPHQLGLSFIMEILFSITGRYDYRIFQLCNVLYSAGIVVIGFKIVQCYSKKILPSFIYCLSIVFCVPLVGYTQWVYGEVASVFFVLLSFFFLLKSKKANLVLYGTFSILSDVFACLYRKNAIIFAIALCIVYFMMLVREKKLLYLLFAILSVAMPLTAYQGVYKSYEIRSGIDICSGLPTITWIAMGLGDSSELGPGGYNNVVALYEEENYSLERMKIISKEEITNRIEIFKNNPQYAADFFKRKAVSQWNQPLYQAIFLGSRFNEDEVPANTLFNDICFGKLYAPIFEMSNLLQIIVFTGMLLFCILLIRKDTDISEYTFVIFIVGGFLFSLIWEGKSRYIFAYYMAMFPMFSIGFWAFAEKSAEWISKIKRK